MVSKEMTHTFWIAANIIFEVGTGQTKDVLMLVNRIDDATIFSTEHEATNYLNFIQVRAPRIIWVIDAPTRRRPQGYLIRGVQTIMPREQF
jgi:hypothetical protein